MKILLKYLFYRAIGYNYRVFYDYNGPNCVQKTKEKLQKCDIARFNQVKRYIHI